MVKKISVTGTLDDKSRIVAQVREHRMIIDQPHAAGGENRGPTPLEYLLLSLMGCVGAIARIVAHQKHINLRGMELSCEGELDTGVLLGKHSDARAGFPKLVVTARVDADLSPEEVVEFLAEVDRRCPVSETLANGCNVEVRPA